jgi:TPR repeat protein
MAYADTRVEAPEFGLRGDADAEDLYRLGLVYSNGMGVATDYVAAHKWFNLAVARGHREAKVCRQEMADLLSPKQVIEAQRAAREWLRKAN